MIIEISDLPEGRHIKKINFDIEFEDGEISNVSNTSNTIKHTVPEATKSVKMPENERKPVDIPPEMTDAEF